MPAAVNDIWEMSKGRKEVVLAGIIIYAEAIFFQFGSRFSVIFKAMKMDLNARCMQSPDLVKYIDHPPVIRRIWYVK